MTPEYLYQVLQEVALIPGDFAEIGVHKGQTFRHLIAAARAQGRHAHAFDSFCGMATPGPHDGEDYPLGKFDVGGPGAFHKLMSEAGIPGDQYSIWPGFTPACFREYECEMNGHRGFAFAYIDLDHYQPTMEALAWVWPRLNLGGVLLLDDYFPGRDNLATRAIDEWLAENELQDRVMGLTDNRLQLRKTL